VSTWDLNHHLPTLSLERLNLSLGRNGLFLNSIKNCCCEWALRFKELISSGYHILTPTSVIYFNLPNSPIFYQQLEEQLAKILLAQNAQLAMSHSYFSRGDWVE
jgi:hypothetical protein